MPVIRYERGLRGRSQLCLILLLAVAIRVPMAMAGGFDSYDINIFHAWAQTLANAGAGGFYMQAAQPDHLPGDVWFLHLLQTTHHIVVGGGLGPGFDRMMRFLPVGFDLIGTVAIYLLVVRLGGRGLVAAALFASAPPLVWISGFMGQWDSISATLILIGCWLATYRGWAWILAGPFLAWGVLVKPQMILPAGICAACVLIWGIRTKSWLPLGAFIGSAIAWAAALLAPFRVGLFWRPTGGSSLLDRLRYATDRWPSIRMNADNLWTFSAHPQPIVSAGTNDGRIAVLGLSYAQVGTIVAVVLASVAAIGMWWALRRRGADLLVCAVWLTTALLMVAFYALTRVHERYEYPVVVGAIVLAAVVRRRVVYVVLTVLMVLFFINLRHYSYFPLCRVYASAQGLVLIALLTMPWWLRLHRPERLGDA